MQILAYTQERFGIAARRRYEALLAAALCAVATEPERAGSVARPEFGAGVRSFHLRHCRRQARTVDGSVQRPRHVLLYRAIRPDLIGIGRVLYDGMELERHLPSDYGDA